MRFLPTRAMVPHFGQQRLRRGFTLIEILVVVAIIAVLVAILVPSLKRARAQARAVACATNMRTCYNALQFYLQANEDYFPWTRSNWTSQPFKLNPWEVLHIYIQKTTPAVSVIPLRNNPDWKEDAINYQVEWYFCPEDEHHHLTSQLTRMMPDGTERDVQYQLSYCAASEVMGIREWEPVPGDIEKPRKSQPIKHQGRMVIFSEEGDDAVLGAENWELRDRNRYKNQIGFEIRHLKGQNIVYLDGHTQFHKLLEGDRDYLGRTQLGLPHFPRAFYPSSDPHSDPEHKAWKNWPGRQITP